MDCLTARVILISKGTRRVVVDGDYIAAKQHVAACHKCQGVLEQEERFDGILKAKLPRKLAPNTLRESILAAIADKRKLKTTPRKRNLRHQSFVGMVAAILVSILAYIAYPILFQVEQREEEYGDPAVSTLVQEHISRTIRENPLDVETSDRTQLERWFALRVDFIVSIPQLDNATLAGGRLCLVGGKRAVALSFQKEKVPITMYIMDREVIDLSPMRIIAAIDTKRIFHADEKGCNMIFWEEKGLIYGLASNMNEHELVNLVAKPS